MVAENSDLTAEIARRLWSYDPQTGELRWRVARPNGVRPGSIAGSPNGEGALLVGATVNGKKRLHLVHRVIWLMMTGSWPADLVDHRDGDKRNNRWANLRDASPRINSENRHGPKRTNRTGLMGVSRNRGKGRWEARIQVCGRQIRIGLFDTPDEAHAAYVAAKRELHQGFTA